MAACNPVRLQAVFWRRREREEGKGEGTAEQQMIMELIL
jgi:hypothetical protein